MAKIDLNDEHAIVIIGSGAGGGTLAHELTRRGHKVVVLEAGQRQSIATFSQDPGEAFAQITWLEPRTASGDWGTTKAFPTLPVWIAKTVGGTTVHWTAATPRLQRTELKSRTVYGAIPGTSIIDWPIEYDELLSWYKLAERRLGTTRRNGNPGMPASNNFKVMYAAAKKFGYKRVHTAYMAINTTARDGRPFCIQQGFCAQGCKTGAKWSTLYTEIPRAEATGNLDLRVEARAMRIEHGPDKRVNAVVYRDKEGRDQRQKARLVCVAGNAIETPRLLLLSESAQFPHGLANSSDQVGRNYVHHITGFIWATFKDPVYFWRGATLAGLIEDELPHNPRRGFVGGYHFELIALDIASLPLAGMPYGWGREWASFLDDYRNMSGIFINGEDLARPDNRITLDPRVKDSFGLPVAHVHVDEHPNDKAMRAHAYSQGTKMFESLGAKRVLHGETPPATHNMGSARMSKDPRDGVANKWGQTHDIPNLFISDGSAFSSSGSANPTLTIVALALRQSGYIDRGLKAGTI